MASYASGLRGSVVSNVETRARSPASFVVAETLSNIASSSISPVSVEIAAITAGDDTSGASTTTSTGDTSPALKSSCRISKARRCSLPAGSVETPEIPDWSVNAGTAAAISRLADTDRLISGCRITSRTMKFQAPALVRSCSRRRGRNGIRSASIRSPSTLRSAGSRVSAARTATTATEIAPSPRLW